MFRSDIGCVHSSLQQVLWQERHAINSMLRQRHEFRRCQTRTPGSPNLLGDPQTYQSLSHISTSSGMKWKMTPPRAPHFGGLWESAVRAMKATLKKLLSSRPLTFKELDTLLVESEAILNSRPLAPVTSTHPDQELALTAGHFLIGSPIKSPPLSRINVDTSVAPLKHWNLVQRLRHDLWTIWRSRYLQSLSARAKWHLQQRNFQPGDVVLLKNETLTIREWLLARVVDVFPGDDGSV